jgi:hypothetical protein
MSAENLSTYPGLNDPIVPVEAGADILKQNQVTGKAVIKAFWTPGTVTVPLPLRLWNARCLILNGFADPDVMDENLAPRKVMRVNEKFEPDPDGRAWVQLYGSDYTGTTLGPFKAVFTLTQVKPLPGAPEKVFYFMWWKYYGTSLVNKAFKEQVWGIAPNRLAVIDTAYAGKRKGVRLLEEGKPALTMVWNSARFADVAEVPQHLAFRTVARRATDDGENDVEMNAVALKPGDSEVPHFPFDRDDDQFTTNPGSELGKDLRAIGFEPATWQCLLNYGGVVKIYDEHGRSTRPE